MFHISVVRVSLCVVAPCVASSADSPPWPIEACLVLEIQNDPPNNRPPLHPLIRLLQRPQRLQLEKTPHLPPRRNLQRLPRVLPVPDIAPQNTDALHHREENIGAQRGLGGQTDDHEVPAGAEVVDGLFVRFGGRGGDDGCVGAGAVACGFDVRDEVLRLEEVDPALGAEFRDELALLGAGVDGAHAQAHRDGVLDGEVAEAAAGAREDDPVADLGVGVLDRAVHGHALRVGSMCK